MDAAHGSPAESYSPWTVVNVVFDHLAAQGLHPVLGGGDPGEPAAALLQSLGITPSAAGDARVGQRLQDDLAQLRTRMLGDG